jgi:maleate isomerase
MPDVLGWRGKFAVIGPSTNTVVAPDYDAMRPAGVTNHYSRIFTPNAAPTNETFAANIAVIGDNVMDAVKSALTCGPDYVLMAVSALSFFGGADGAGVGVSVGSHSLTAALHSYGRISRIAILSPYWPVMNQAVIGYFTDMGFRVVRDVALECKSWTAIAEVTPAQCRDALKRLDGDDVDAIVQVGTNLSMVRLAAAAELWLGKPVIAVNTATYWHALRANGIRDRIEGFGRLLTEH